MDLNFTPLIEKLQGKLISIALSPDEPKVALLLEGEKTLFIDTEKGHILLPKKQEDKDGGGQLDEAGEGNVSSELQNKTCNDEQGNEVCQGPSGEV